MRIGLDIMGGDFAPGAVIEGAIDTLVHLSGEDKLVLIGDQQAVESKLRRVLPIFHVSKLSIQHRLSEWVISLPRPIRTSPIRV